MPLERALPTHSTLPFPTNFLRSLGRTQIRELQPRNNLPRLLCLR